MLKHILYAFGLVIILFFSACLGVLFYATEQPWVDFTVLEHYNPGKPSILLDDQGHEWARFELDKREIVHFNQIPPSVIHAFLAAEDWQFFSHPGLSLKGIIRSTCVNLIRFKRAQGASTITQQLVRLLFFETKKNFSRKIKEQILALVVERQFTKEQILETYLNHIYLGAGIYGVEAACQRFWGKSVTECTHDEAAVLAAIVRCPRQYCPLYNPSSAKKRRDLILKNMNSLGFITQKDFLAAQKKHITLVEKEKNTFGSHIKETMRLFLEKQFGKKKLYTGGLIIQTTLNRSMQETAEKAFKEHLQKLHTKISPHLEGAFVCLEGSSGAIKALIGGCNFETSQFNRALSARRQVGSTFKPLVFAYALSRGKTFRDKEIDEPLTFKQGSKEWNPRNTLRTFMGPMTLAYALSRSNNIISIKTFLSAGPEGIIQLAQSCGLTITHTYPSLALGCLEASPLETTAMMNIFAQQGTYVEPHSIVWVKNEWGTKLYKHKTTKKQVLLPFVTSQVAKVLSLRIEQARKKTPDLWCTCDAIGKSGTTNDSRTCWFIGSTPEYTTGVYVGFDDNQSLGKWAFGSWISFPIWREFNRIITQPTEKFIYDTRLKEITIDGITGELCSLENPQALTILVPPSSANL